MADDVGTTGAPIEPWSRISEVLRGIDLDELAGFLDRPTASRAILDHRAALQARRA